MSKIILRNDFDIQTTMNPYNDRAVLSNFFDFLHAETGQILPPFRSHLESVCYTASSKLWQLKLYKIVKQHLGHHSHYILWFNRPLRISCCQRTTYLKSTIRRQRCKIIQTYKSDMRSPSLLAFFPNFQVFFTNLSLQINSYPIPHDAGWKRIPCIVKKISYTGIRISTSLGGKSLKHHALTRVITRPEPQHSYHPYTRRKAFHLRLLICKIKTNSRLHDTPIRQLSRE